MVLYFAYGSNLNQKDLHYYCKRKNLALIDLKSKSTKVCFLEDYCLEFNYYSSSRCGGAANIESAIGNCVEGVLFEINESDHHTISQKEGNPNYYHEILVTVTLKDGSRIGNVITYVVCENKKKKEFTPPTREYKELIINGAKDFGLSEQWIRKLENIQCIN